VADIYRFSERVIDLAERLEDVADAAKGKGNRKGSLGTRWLLLPAAGAGLYALATSGSFSRQAKGVMNQAKTRATDLPAPVEPPTTMSAGASICSSRGRR